jgi:sulfite reductase (NADPH) hemoprotein beta-component
VPREQKAAIEALARNHGLLAESRTPIRLAGIACVALPTCPQAMAEAERQFPTLLDKVERLAERHRLGGTDVVMRMTGCPNGCARPYVAEIALVGKGPGRYNLMLGGDGRGLRLNRLYRENLTEEAIIQTLDMVFARFAAERLDGERLGDYSIRSGLVPAVRNPAEDFHDHS